uniref:Uncharacterized protein n=1 Tax=Cacopsylla melanoneura TaxID=428564 RepID=A0A8D8YDM9_9HEMI
MGSTGTTGGSFSTLSCFKFSLILIDGLFLAKVLLNMFVIAVDFFCTDLTDLILSVSVSIAYSLLPASISVSSMSSVTEGSSSSLFASSSSLSSIASSLSSTGLSALEDNSSLSSST